MLPGYPGVFPHFDNEQSKIARKMLAEIMTENTYEEKRKNEATGSSHMMTRRVDSLQIFFTGPLCPCCGTLAESIPRIRDTEVE
jgi:hypothetical protein